MVAPEDAFETAARDRAERITAHDKVRDSADFIGEQARLQRLTKDFIEAIRAASFAFTRYPDSEKWLLQSSTDDLLESAVAIHALAEQGVFNAGRRELRYMLELVVKCVFVDQQLPGGTPLDDRVTFAKDTNRVPRSSVDVADQLVIRMLSDPELLANEVRGLFGSLSGYVHVSGTQFDERFVRAKRGELVGFESVKSLRAFNAALTNAYDILLVLIFEGIGPMFTGDLFIQLFDSDPKWKFHKTKYTAQVSSFFDYKTERRSQPEA